MEMTSKMIKTAYKKLILSDSLLCAVLSIQAESVGVSLEDYVDRFLDAFYQDPASFNLLRFQNNKLK